MKRILIVEDEHWIAEELQETLISNGYSVIAVVDNFEKAMLAMNDEVPDLVILDIRLNGPGTGIDIAREINLKWGVPFVFLSSLIEPELLHELKEEVPHSILSKPCKPVDLLAAVSLAFSPTSKSDLDADIIDEESFFVKNEHAYQRIQLKDLLFIKGEGNYTRIQLRNDRIVLRANLKDFSFLNEIDSIYQIHRSYLVNVKNVDKIYSKHVQMGEFEVPISKESREEVLKRIYKVR